MAFATILAVVGPMLAGARRSATTLRNGRQEGQRQRADEIRVSKISTVLGLLAMALGIASEKINVAFAVGLAFSIAASVQLPRPAASMMWRARPRRARSSAASSA